MAEVAQAALGPDVYLFHEQWVVKGAEQGMQFAWHQDSGYVKWGDTQTKHQPYLTCWCTLSQFAASCFSTIPTTATCRASSSTS